MSNPKIPVATAIPLSALNGEEYYAVVIPEEARNRLKYNLWLFRKRCGIAHYCTGKNADQADSTLTVDGIKALDSIGEFDEIKEMLAEVE